jgi:hypothetical protein
MFNTNRYVDYHLLKALVVGFTTRCTEYANMLFNGFKKINLDSVKYVYHKDAN